MKKILIVTALFLTTAKLFAQNCSDYVFMKKGRTIETTSYNAMGKVFHKAVMLVSDITTEGGTITATLNASNFGQNGQSTGNNTIIYKCDNGTLAIDVSSLSPQQGNIKFSSALMKYPSTLTVGQHLDDVAMNMQMNMGNKTFNSKCQITDRTVVDEESLTTPAGTWKCYRMTYKITTTFESMNMPPSTTNVTEWYVPGFALIQWQMGAMITKITAIKG